MSTAKFIKGPVLFNEAKVIQKDDGKFILAGRFGLAEDVNENVRVYTKRLWANLLARPSVKQMIKDKRMLGQLGHPDTVEPNLENVSHAVTYLELREDGEIYGEAEVFDTPAGKILKILYNAGVRLGISSRGYIPDDVDYVEGIGQEVPDEYELVGFDFVIDPSTHGAFPVLKESTKQQLSKIVLESKQQLGRSLCESVNKMLKSNNSVNLSLSLNGCSSIRKKQIRGLMEGKYPEATFVIKGDELQVTDLNIKQQIAVSSDFNKLVNENNFIKRVNSDSSSIKEKEVKEMPKVPTTAVSKEAILEGNYNLAKEVIAELLKDKELSEEVIEDLVKRYKISEAKVAKLTKQLNSKVCSDAETEKVAESVIEDLKNRYLIAEEIIKDLVNRYNEKCEALKSLQKKYNTAEAVVSEMRQTTVKDRKEVNPSEGEETSEEVIAELIRRVKTSEEVIAEMRDRYLLAESIIKDLTARYTLSEEVISEMVNKLKLSESTITDLEERNLLSESVIAEFKSAYSSLQTAKATPKKEVSKKVAPKATSKAVTESKQVPQSKKTSSKDYSEYPYTPKAKKNVLSESVKSVRQTSPATTRRASYEDKLASIVASVQ